MKHHTITKAFGKRETIYLFPDYISNETIAVYKGVISNRVMVDQEATAKEFFGGKKAHIITRETNDPILRINTNITEPRLHTATKFFIETRKQDMTRFFIDAVTGRLIPFNCASLDQLGLNTADARLFGNGYGAYRDTQEANEMTMLIMPVKWEESDATVFQATLMKLEESVHA